MAAVPLLPRRATAPAFWQVRLLSRPLVLRVRGFVRVRKQQKGGFCVS